MQPSSTRRLLAAAMAMALSATACGTGTSDDDGAPDATSPDAEQPGELEVWFPGNLATEIELVTETLVPEFEAANNVEVTVTFVDWPDMSPKLNAAFAGDIAPDVFGHGVAATAGFAAADRVEPLDDYVATMSDDDRTDLAPVLDKGQVDGTTYMIPMSIEARLVAYRKDLLAEAGLDPDDPPTTWAEAYDAAQALTVGSGSDLERAGLLLASGDGGRPLQFTMLLYGEGGQLLSDDGTTATWNSAEGVRALEYFVRLFDGEEAVSDQLGGSFEVEPAAQHPLATGHAAMASVHNTKAMQIVTEVPELADEIGVLPVLGEGSWGGGAPGLFVNADSPNKDLAWSFIEFMLSADVSLEYAETIGSIPARASAIDSEYVSNEPVLQAFLEAVPRLSPNPNVPAWVEVRDTLSKHIERALHGQVSPQEALDAAAAEADELLN